MRELLLVGLGGGIGAIARYTLGGIVLHRTPDWHFPISTFIVNVVGCFVAGILAGLIQKHGYFSTDTRLFLFTGLLGGFTTFSAFGLETVMLIRRGDAAIAASYVFLSVILGAGLLWIGFRVGSLAMR